MRHLKRSTSRRSSSKSASVPTGTLAKVTPSGGLVMPERVVTSPTGDEVLIFDDGDFLELAGFADSSTAVRSLVLRLDGRSGERAAVLASLWIEGGVVDKSGQAAAKLGERIGVAGATVRAIVKAPIMAAAVEIQGNARRTHSLRLVALPDRWHRHLSAEVAEEPASTAEVEPLESAGRAPEADLGGHGPVAEGDIEEAVFPPAVAEVPLSPLAGLQPVEVELASAVATALLSQVIDIVATGDQAAPQLSKLALDVKALEERLGTSTAYVDKLRRQLRDTGDELAAVKHERDGLRQRLRATEHNLRVAVGADAQRIIDVEVRRQVDRVMREAPAGAGSKVAAS